MSDMSSQPTSRSPYWSPRMIHTFIKRGVPLSDWDADAEHEAMSAHIDQEAEDKAVAEGLALVRAAMEKYDEECDCVKYATCNYARTGMCLVEQGCPNYAEETVSIPEALAICVEAGVLQVVPGGTEPCLAKLWGLA